MPNLLDVDPSILERNLMLKEFQDSDEITADYFFNIKPKDPDEIPWKPVRPNPGFCVKLRTTEGDKVFVNVCHTDAIPEPEKISEEKLLEMIMDDDVPSFRVPISIGDLHIESDKSRNPCSVYDIAVNSKFYKKMDSSEVFNTFFLNVSIQALQEKFSLNLDLKSEKPFLLLKNRKVLGKLQIHRIQQRDVKKAPGQLIQEIDSKSKKSLIEVIGEEETPVKSNETSLSNNKQAGRIGKNLVLNADKESSSKEKNVGCNLSNEYINTNSIFENQPITNQSTLNKPSTPEEKGTEECRRTKANLIEEINTIDSDKMPKEEISRTSPTDNEVENSGNCSGLFCIKQYPEEGYPDILVATVHINVESSKDFNLHLDDNRLCITLSANNKCWFDVTLPFDIDVNKAEACFVNEHKKLMIKMDVLKPNEKFKK